MYAVYRAAAFDRMAKKLLSAAEREEVDRLERTQLRESPHVGDPLGYPFFREKKIGGKRIYFLIYEDIRAVLLVTVSGKKAQQETIANIKESLDTYDLVIRAAIKRHGASGRVSRPRGSP